MALKIVLKLKCPVTEMVQTIMAITLCYPEMWRVITGYVALMNT